MHDHGTPEAEDLRVQNGILSLLLHEPPGLLTMRDVAAEIGSEIAAIDAVRALSAIGLLRPRGRVGAADPRRASFPQALGVSVAERFGRNLFLARRRAGLSQQETADRAGVHRTELGHLENGRRTARVDTLMRLAGALEVDAFELLKEIVWQPVENPAGSFHQSHWVP